MTSSVCFQIEPATSYSGLPTSGTTREYFIRPSSNPVFFPAIAADVVVRAADKASEEVVGSFGVVHPDVLSKKAFDVKWPCSALELNIESFVL